jgi:hypothetical protein
MQNKYIVVEEQKEFSVRVLKISDMPGLKIMVFSRNIFSKKIVLFATISRHKY